MEYPNTQNLFGEVGGGRLQARLAMAIQLQGTVEMNIPLFKKQAKNTIQSTNI